MDAALSIVTSLDGERKLFFWWNPGKSMIANSFIPYIHADPYFGTLEPGEEAYAEGLILFTEGDINLIVKYLLERSEAGGRVNDHTFVSQILHMPVCCFRDSKLFE